MENTMNIVSAVNTLNTMDAAKTEKVGAARPVFSVMDVDTLLSVIDARTTKALRVELDRREALAAADAAEKDAYWTARWEELNAEFRAKIDAAQKRGVEAGQKALADVYQTGYGLRKDAETVTALPDGGLSWCDRMMVKYFNKVMIGAMLVGAAVGVFLGLVH